MNNVEIVKDKFNISEHLRVILSIKMGTFMSEFVLHPGTYHGYRNTVSMHLA